MYSLFPVRITLTESGLANWILIVKMLFEFIRMLINAGPQKWIFDEMQQVAMLEYGKCQIM